MIRCAATDTSDELFETGDVKYSRRHSPDSMPSLRNALQRRLCDCWLTRPGSLAVHRRRAEHGGIQQTRWRADLSSNAACPERSWRGQRIVLEDTRSGVNKCGGSWTRACVGRIWCSRPPSRRAGVPGLTTSDMPSFLEHRILRIFTSACTPLHIPGIYLLVVYSMQNDLSAAFD